MDEKQQPACTDRLTLSWQRKLRRLRPWEWALIWVPVLGALVVTYLHLTSPPPAISQANYERIAVGMREREVEGLIRARPGYYGVFVNHGQCLSEEWGRAERLTSWGDSYGILTVGYDAEGRVCWKGLEYHPGGVPRNPDQWPWWRRLLDRSVPGAKRTFVYISL
jgi:hypothetical protein